MRPANKVRNNEIRVGLKLFCSLAGGAVLSRIVTTCLLNRLFFRLPKSIPLAVSFVPFVSLAFYLLRGRDKWLKMISHCKYSPICSYYFTYDKFPIKSKRINIDRIRKEIKSGDIILRKQKNYLVELIFSQNSFFTHVGICYSENGIMKIWDCTGEHKVCANDLENFCSSDDIAILRLSIKDTELKQIESSLEEVLEEEKIRYQITNDFRTLDNNKNLKINELKIFESLLKELKSEEFTPGSVQNILDVNNYAQIVSERARSLKGIPFDFEFDFNNFDKFSCIEYVWYCYKCLYPLHRIKVKDFEYFNSFPLPVIIPDVFIHNDLFEYRYTSLPGIQNKKQLKNFVEVKQRQFTKFVINMIFWDIVILFAVKKLFRSRLKI